MIFSKYIELNNHCYTFLKHFPHLNKIGSRFRRMVRREQKALLERADHMVLSSHRESVGVLNSEEKHPRGARKTKEMGLALGRGLWLS